MPPDSLEKICCFSFYSIQPIFRPIMSGLSGAFGSCIVSEKLKYSWFLRLAVRSAQYASQSRKWKGFPDRRPLPAGKGKFLVFLSDDHFIKVFYIFQLGMVKYKTVFQLIFPIIERKNSFCFRYAARYESPIFLNTTLCHQCFHWWYFYIEKTKEVL